jgi:large subunit ribosomal protein L25
MEVGKLTVEVRTVLGKNESRRLRATGKVPGVIYGKGMEPMLLSVDPKALKASLDPAKRQNTVIDLTIEGGQSDKKSFTVMLKEYQFDRIRQEIEHVDLLAIDVDKEVHVDVPLVYTGKAQGVVDGGQLTIAHRHITVICKPQAIPSKIEADVTSLGLGMALHVSDLVLPMGVRAGLAAGEGLASVVAPRAEKVEAKAEEAAADAAVNAAAAGAAGAKAAEAKPGDAKAAAAAPAKKEDKKK